MKISRSEFLNSPRKCITLLGMSGMGKTYITGMLSDWGWASYSCDYEIGSKYLKDALSQVDGFDMQDISALSKYLGKLGRSDLGGFDLELFRERQQAYYDAECAALEGMCAALDNSEEHFVHDSTGSLCEIQDDALIDQVGSKTLLVYLVASKEDEAVILERAQKYPKPLFFPKEFLNEQIARYVSEVGLSDISDAVPDEFSRWVFPHLFEARKPKYQKLADRYGVAISASEFKDIGSSDEFIQIVAEHLSE